MQEKLGKINILLAGPRGFCAGVTRAIEVVEKALQKYGTPLYVKHEIVHNEHVVNYFKQKGVIFVDDVSQAPDGATLIYSAHGVSDLTEQKSKAKNLLAIDATCPLVKKVHREVASYDAAGMHIILIGHKNHPEMLGTSGRIKSGNFTIIETLEEAIAFNPPQGQDNLALATQTTLSMSDTKDITDYLKSKFASLAENLKNDICYATENRQTATRQIITDSGVDCLIVIGSHKSSNSNRLRDIGLKNGIPSFLFEFIEQDVISHIAKLCNAKPAVQDGDGNVKILITAGASAPETLVQSCIKTLSESFDVTCITELAIVPEDVKFFLPKEVR